MLQIKTWSTFLWILEKTLEVWNLEGERLHLLLGRDRRCFEVAQTSDGGRFPPHPLVSSCHS